jgi:hypothetical protein
MYGAIAAPSDVFSPFDPKVEMDPSAAMVVPSDGPEGTVEIKAATAVDPVLGPPMGCAFT